MAAYKPYPKYKDFGLEWLGSAPADWVRRRADFVVDTNRTQVTPSWLQGKDVIHYSIPNVQEFGAGIVESGDDIDSAKLLIRERQLLVSKLNPRKATLCLVEPSDEYPVVASSEFVPIMPGKADAKYTYYLWSSDVVTSLLSSQVQSVTRSHQRVNPTDILKIDWVWPSLAEQEAIAIFLEYKTAQIDVLIARKVALLDKLEEKRISMVTNAVTKGLDVRAKMKDSGVDWLGAVPAHWECPPLYSRYSVDLGKMLNESKITGNHLFPYLRNTDVQWDSINYEDLPSIDVFPDERSRYLVGDGDLLVCEGGDIGRAAIVKVPGQPVAYQKALHRLRVASPCEIPRYMFYTLFWASKVGLFVADGNPNTIPHLTGEKLRRYRFPCPPRDEQVDIACYLDEQNAKLDGQVAKAKMAMQRLSEYRAALITQAVTGKIDVRDVVVPGGKTEQAA